VAGVLAAALEADAVVIPFGGGTSISGSLEPPAGESRPVISVDLERLDKVISVDPVSRLARVQAGVFGPDLEEQLQARGYTFGHYPDSFTHSTLGGWIATRSSGMQSDRYGDVADLTRGLRVVTPSGILATEPVPATSTGPSVRQMILGSEGRLGIITEATVEVRRLPESRQILGYLFPTFLDGLAAMRDIAAAECSVSVSRVSDAPETKFSFATRKQPTLLDKAQSKALTTFLTRRLGFDLDQMALSFLGFEGSERHVAEQRKAVGKIVKRHGGLCVGSGPGALYDQKKFDTPYIRDFMLDRGIPRRRFRDGDAVEPPGPRPRCGQVGRRGCLRRARCPRLLDVPPLAQLSRRRLPLLHVLLPAPHRMATSWSSTTTSSRRSSRRSSTTGRRSPTTTPSGPSTPAGSSRTSRRPGSG